MSLRNIVSRGAGAYGVFAGARKLNIINTTSIRHGHEFYYRTACTKHDKKILFLANFVSAFAWWWMLWHLVTQYDHIIGEFPYPNPNKWTDDMLGVPLPPELITDCDAFRSKCSIEDQPTAAAPKAADEASSTEE